ncbi:MAG: AAA family ATPase, partial [Desulfobacterales bacterium]|nr:AAA family ATPase [Desulfobacterales bacterium]
MYRQYFNLEKKPFQINSDNQFLWLGKKHASALELLKRGIAEKQGLLTLIGDVGTGKTTLINEIIHTLDNRTQFAVIEDSCFEMHHVFLTLAQAFGFEGRYQKGETFSSKFLSFLKTANSKGQKVLVIVDEAQRLPKRFLKEIISWGGFGLNHVLTVILSGQLEFRDVLRTSLGNSWHYQIKIHAFLEPLNEDETKSYINKRLEIAGAKREIFLISAIHEIYLYSKGFPRLINISCDQALIAAFANGVGLVDAQTFKESIGKIDLPRIPIEKENVLAKEDIISHGPWFQRKSMAGLAVLVSACLFMGYLYYYGEPGPSPLKKTNPVSQLDPMPLEEQVQISKAEPATESLSVVKPIKQLETIEPAVPKLQEPTAGNIGIEQLPPPYEKTKESPAPVSQLDPMPLEEQVQISKA